ncbi:MAG: YitT family protein [Turicibacter sp.]|nr:YitT family protein [Turicibacter sp.]
MSVVNKGKQVFAIAKDYVTILVGTLLFVFAMQWFIVPAGLYSGGLTGVLQLLLPVFAHWTGLDFNLGLLLFVFNVPILWLAWNSIGRRFAILSVAVVILSSVLLGLVPVHNFADDMLLNTVFGGVLVGLGGGMILKVGASSGGLDVISQYISLKYDGSVGKYSFIVNAVIILVAGLVYGWTISLYTLINIFITATVYDRVHTAHQNLTLYIVTDKEDAMIQGIWEQLYRGITLLDARGAYTKESKSVLMIVLSSYELYEALQVIKAVDSRAFTNVVRSEAVQGNFVKKSIS